MQYTVPARQPLTKACALGPGPTLLWVSLVVVSSSRKATGAVRGSQAIGSTRRQNLQEIRDVVGAAFSAGPNQRSSLLFLYRAWTRDADPSPHGREKRAHVVKK